MFLIKEPSNYFFEGEGDSIFRFGRTLQGISTVLKVSITLSSNSSISDC